MSDKERLEDIKNFVKTINGDFTAQLFGYDIKPESIVNDFKWLIKQAARVETLERLREEDSTYYNELLTKLREQNERYKQALEFYADESNYCVSLKDDFEPILQDNGDTARQVLGWEEE